MSDVTPTISRHARERCMEMGISTKVAKQIVRHPDLTRPDIRGKQYEMVWSRMHPRYMVVVANDCDPPQVVTVIFYARDFAERNGADYIREGVVA